MTRAYSPAQMKPGAVHARGLALLASNDEPEELICNGCSGSGEGSYEGTTCRSCGGSGVERTERDEPDWDAIRKDRIERDLMGGAL